MDATKVNVTVDRNVKVSERTMTFVPGTEYFLGMCPGLYIAALLQMKASLKINVLMISTRNLPFMKSLRLEKVSR